METFQEFAIASEPMDRQADEGLTTYLRNRQKSYFKILDEFSNSKDPLVREILSARQDTEMLFDAVIEATEKYLEGYPHQAQAIFDSGLSQVGAWLDALIFGHLVDGQNEWLFRMRVFNDLTTKSRYELFHIPFEQRQNIKAQRFSLPGIPCLYAGSSSYVCWEELNRPHLEKTVTMGLKAIKPVRVLMLAVTHNNLISQLATSDGRLAKHHQVQGVSYFACFPLFISIAISPLYPNAHFVEEYIVPQLLLRWVREHPMCFGIRYFSTHLNPYTTPRLASNYVFPTRSNPPNGHCNVLTSLFNATEPLSWSLFHSLGLPRSESAYGFIFITKETCVKYAETSFGIFDSSIVNAKIKPLQPNILSNSSA